MNDRIQLKRAARVLFHWPRAQAGEEVPPSVRGLAAVPSHLVNDRPSPPLLPGSGGGMQPLPPLSYGGGGGGSAASLLRGEFSPGWRGTGRESFLVAYKSGAGAQICADTPHVAPSNPLQCGVCCQTASS